jgi:glycosyltransferase involved in cell wall biosynthesis
LNPLPRTGNENPASRASLRQAMGLKDDQFLIAMVGRLAPEKGHALFLRAMKDWLFANAKTHLLIVGDGPQRDALHSLVNSLGLTGEVTFTGQRDNVSELMHMSDVVVVPSLREGLGYVALEAMAAGCPVVAFAVGGLPEIVEHETSGLLVEGGDYPALIEAIDRIRTEHDVTMRLIEGGTRKADCFTADHHVKELIELYRSLVDKS